MTTSRTRRRLARRAEALARVWALSRWGADARSRLVLACVALLTQLDPKRHPLLGGAIRGALARARSRDEHLEVSLRDVEGGRHAFAFRASPADFQSIFECFVQDMYDWQAARRGGLACVLDCGAHIGSFLAACKCRFPHLRVHAIEPDRFNYQLLRRNAASFAGVSCEHVAAWKEDAELAFIHTGTNESRLVGGEPTGAVAVAARDIATLIPRDWEPARTWIKLDIEGAEYEVLPRLLGAGIRPRIISIEIHDFLRRDGDRLWRLILDAGFAGDLAGCGDHGYVCRQATALAGSPRTAPPTR